MVPPSWDASHRERGRVAGHRRPAGCPLRIDDASTDLLASAVGVGPGAVVGRHAHEQLEDSLVGRQGENQRVAGGGVLAGAAARGGAGVWQS